MNKGIVWWHFSDLHWEVGSSTERRAFLKVLFEDLDTRLIELGQPDFVIFSGDLAYHGEEAEYDAARQDFLARLICVIGPGTPIFLVPGNHDLRRASARTVNPKLVTDISSVQTLLERLDDGDFVDMVKRPFAHFDAFCAKVMPAVTHDGLGWWHRLQIRDSTVFIAGINSAWASSYRTDSEGRVEDERYLMVGQRQLLNLTEHSQGADLSMLVMHHPPRWLKGFSENQVRQAVQEHADIVAFGHTHEASELSQVLTASGPTVLLPAPAIYDRKSPTDSTRYARGYSVATFDPENRRGAAHYFKYSDAFTVKFDRFLELYSGGNTRFDFDLARRAASTSDDAKTRFESYTDAIGAFPALQVLNRITDTMLNAQDDLGRHTLDHYESTLTAVTRETALVDQHLGHVFWEAACLGRMLLAFDLLQIQGSKTKQFVPKNSLDRLCGTLEAARVNAQLHLQLGDDEYRRLFGMSLDTFSLQSDAVAAVSEDYRRLFAVPWALSRLILYLDHPHLIPAGLPSEGRIADLYHRGKAASPALLTVSLTASTSALSCTLLTQDRNSFLAVTLLKHYFDAVLRHTAQFWRQGQRMFPPVSLRLDFPRWRDKRIDAYEFTVETTPIVKLLMGRAMYRDARHVWFREILQNALDANSARRALDGDAYSSTLEISFDGARRCTIRDNGIGMSQQHILQYLTRLGRSIWNSEELTEGKKSSRDGALRAMGKFGIGFAAVFQDAERVSVSTRFFRDVGESGWQVDFTAVDKPFTLEAAHASVGTEIDIHLKPDKDKALSPNAFIKLVNDFFLYIDERVIMTPDAGIARNLPGVTILDPGQAERTLLRESSTIEQIGSYRFALRCVFAFDYKQKDKDDRLPPNYLLVSNAGVKVFTQTSLRIKPGKQYVLLEESEGGAHEEDPRQHGITHYWVIVDFEKGSSPILPSRLEIDIDSAFAKEFVPLVQRRFNACLRSACEELAKRGGTPRARRKAILGALMQSTEEHRSYYGQRQRPNTFCKAATIEEEAVRLYEEFCDVCVESEDGTQRFVPLSSLRQEPPGIFAVDTIAKSTVFRMYANALGRREWVVIDGAREYVLFHKAIGSMEWKGHATEEHIFAERRTFTEIPESPLTRIIRGDYAVIREDIFGEAAFIVLPARLPGSWRRGAAAARLRADVMTSCPPRVLINSKHQLVRALETYLEEPQRSDAERRELHHLLQALSEGVIENGRTTVARELWPELQRDLKRLLNGSMSDIAFEGFVIRR